jgi:hypothetical protein
VRRKRPAPSVGLTALALAGVMAVNVAGSVPELRDDPAQHRRHTVTPAPRQRWGSAAQADRAGGSRAGDADR